MRHCSHLPRHAVLALIACVALAACAGGDAPPGGDVRGPIGPTTPVTPTDAATIAALTTALEPLAASAPPESLAAVARRVPGVAGAVASASGGVVNVTLSSGQALPYLLTARVFTSGASALGATGREVATENGAAAFATAGTAAAVDTIVPKNRKALLLVPFPSVSSRYRADSIHALLRALGFTVTRLAGQEVHLAHVRADYLGQFGVVFLDTHGAADTEFGSVGGRRIVSGSLAIADTAVQLSGITARATVGLPPFRTPVVSFGEEYWRQTAGGTGTPFSGTVFFVLACESNRGTVSHSIAQAARLLGASAVYGWNALIDQGYGYDGFTAVLEGALRQTPWSTLEPKVRRGSWASVAWSAATRFHYTTDDLTYDNFAALSTGPVRLLPSGPGLVSARTSASAVTVQGTTPATLHVTAQLGADLQAMAPLPRLQIRTCRVVNGARSCEGTPSAVWTPTGTAGEYTSDVFYPFWAAAGAYTLTVEAIDATGGVQVIAVSPGVPLQINIQP